MDDLLQQGITAYKTGKRDEARKIFIAFIKKNPESERGWGWMYDVSIEDKERIYCLKQMLRINPKNEKANQLLAKLTTPDFSLQQPITPPKVAESQLISEQKPHPLPPQTQKPVAPQKPLGKKQRNNLQIGIAATVILCAFFLCVGIVFNGSNNGGGNTNTNAGDTSAWIPSGFKQWDKEIAFRFVKGIACSYSSAESCSHLEVYTRYGCPNSLYVEVAFENSNGTQVDWGNDTATGLSPGTKALLEFITFDSSATTTNITQIKCY